MRTLLTGVRLTAMFLLAFVAVIVIADWATSSPQLCASCHTMAPMASAWRESGHAEVKCVSCHEPPGEWYGVPQALVSRGGLLGRDVYQHLTGKGPAPKVQPGGQPMADAVCLQCHDPNRKATSRYGILIEHAKHAKRNGSCVSCHLETAHPQPARGRALSLMARCFSCHGTSKSPEAGAQCALCHPKDFDLRPQSHASAEWKRGHGRVSATDRRQCAMCHTERFCSDCHGLAMPHPSGWARGESGHAVVAARNRRTCATCHDERPDLCSMCHHKAYDAKLGDWVKQHPLEVDVRGAAFCMRCHEPLYCVKCHKGVHALPR